jgi:hypothetical protein
MSCLQNLISLPSTEVSSILVSFDLEGIALTIRFDKVKIHHVCADVLVVLEL